MELIHENLLAPAVCFICETGAMGEKDFIDTGRNHNPGFPSPIQGRKYLCQACVTEAANTIGLGDVSKAEAAIAEARGVAERAEAAHSLEQALESAKAFLPANVVQAVAEKEARDAAPVEAPAPVEEKPKAKPKAAPAKSASAPVDAKA